MAALLGALALLLAAQQPASDPAEALRQSTAAHDQAVGAESVDAARAEALYRRALGIRPQQWESSLRLGTLLMGQGVGREAEAEAALRYTIDIGVRRRADLCAPRTNLGVLLTERAFG
eukprot:COSAG04_NODE_2239_length_4464_cov_4.122940_8_plen_117_part_01